MVLFSDYEKYNEDLYTITIKDISSIENTNDNKDDFLGSIKGLERKAKGILEEYQNNTHFFSESVGRSSSGRPPTP